jgi:hypothetical protein
VRWLVDEMLPPTTATELNALGHDAISVRDAELNETADAVIYQAAVDQARVVVTENSADFAAIVEQRVACDDVCVPVLFVRRRNFARGGGLASDLARYLDAWASDNSDPYPGIHWP